MTKPPGVEVFVRPYDDRNGDWRRLGQTPINGLLQFRFERDGYETLDLMQYAQLSTPTGTPPRLELEMPSRGTVTKGMVQIPPRRVALHLSGFNYQESVSAPAYEIDKYEVTNREFKAFVEAGGYDNEKFWTHPFVNDGRPVSWAEAMTKFRDATGRPGPSATRATSSWKWPRWHRSTARTSTASAQSATRISRRSRGCCVQSTRQAAISVDS